MRVSSLGGSEKSSGAKSILGGGNPPAPLYAALQTQMLDVCMINCYVNMKHRPV